MAVSGPGTAEPSVALGPPSRPPRLAQRAFYFAAVYGAVTLVPAYFLESRLVPPPSHPEQFYGFLGVALAWQFAFLVISLDVARFRPLMPVAVAEKLAFGVPAVVLHLQGRAPAPVLVLGLVDLAFAGLFLAAYRSVRR